MTSTALCPQCFNLIGQAVLPLSGRDGSAPAVGDVGLCGKCLTLLECTAAEPLAVRRYDIRGLSPGMQVRIHALRSVAIAIKRRSARK